MLKYKDVSPDRKAQFNASKHVVQQRVKESKVVPLDLRHKLERYLDDNERAKVVEVYVDFPVKIPYWAETRGFCVHLQPRTFRNWEVTGKPRLTAVLLHELVHVAGGRELDAEVFENLLFREDEGAWPPTLDDLGEFAKKKGKGAWLSMSLDTGVVTGQAERRLCRIERIPRRGTGKPSTKPGDKDSRVIPLR